MKGGASIELAGLVLLTKQTNQSNPWAAGFEFWTGLVAPLQYFQQMFLTDHS